MNDTFSKYTKMFETPQQIQFTSPMLIAECAERLQQGIGKPMGCAFARIEGDIENVDEATYQFTLYQDYRGGHKIVGHLYSQPDSGTLVDALHTVDRSSWLTGLFFVVIMVIVTFAVELPKGEVANALWMSIVFVAITAGIAFVSLKAQPMSQLVWWFERTLKQ